MALISLEIPPKIADAVILCATIVEIYLGVILLARIHLNYTISLSILIMFLFTGYLWYLSTMENPPSCGCLGLVGLFSSSKREAFAGLFLNCLILRMLQATYRYHFPNITTNSVENQPVS